MQKFRIFLLISCLIGSFLECSIPTREARVRFQAGTCQSWDLQIRIEMTLVKSLFKGTVSRDFLLLVFFMNQFPPSPRVSHQDRFEFFRKFAEIFASQGAQPVSTKPVANLPPVPFVLLTPGWQIMRTISGCRHLKVILKAKIYIRYMLTLLPKGAQSKLLKFFCLKIFSIYHRCR